MTNQTPFHLLCRSTCLRIVWSLSLLIVTHCTFAKGDKATHKEIKPLKFNLGKSGKIETMAMNADGNLLTGVSWEKRGARKALQGRRRRRRGRRRGRPKAPSEFDPNREYAIKVISPQGKILDTWKLKSLVPKMMHGNTDGTVYVGGAGSLSLLDKKGEVKKTIKLAKLFNGDFADAHVSGLTANEKYLFVAFGHGWSLRATEDIVRFNRDLSSPKVIIKRQFGCCSHLDLDVKGDELLVAENSRHRVNRYSFDGKSLGKWGRRDRRNISGFAACCNPVNFDFGSQKEVLYTAESGIGRVKKYSAKGKYLGLVGYVDTTKFDRGSFLASQSCYIPIEVNKDASRIYIMDVRANIIRVLAVQ
ncbi:hypothetical protein MNBD_PLANCTO02-2193 [hydrothermal vent metagenome]|uniref:Uncharacterized protein n=1 Tax=hydrothermal vent metagenome TaxID=652676 RepID=A0A3B1DQY6_9ZZZZ